jgi:HPt (histidine-containing phosphotransfer) domain-containing protein
MAGDREQCLAAGMDAYVSKPLRAAEVFAAIDAVLQGTPASMPVASSESDTPLVDVPALIAGFGGRADLLAEVIDVFITDAPMMLTRLRNAARAGDMTETAAAAHGLKGSAGLFARGEAFDRAGALEARARSGDGTDAIAASDEIERSVSRLLSELRHVRESLPR